MSSASAGFDPPNDLRLLADACRRETERFRKYGESDPRYCLEIFRRALVRAGDEQGAPFVDEDARTLLVSLYTDFIKANISRKALSNGPLDDVIQQVWFRFWKAAASGLDFSQLDQALAYLRRVTVSAVIEAKREEFRRNREIQLSRLGLADDEQGGETKGAELPDGALGADPLFANVEQARFRERCREVLSNTEPLLYTIFWLRFGLALPPRKIAKKFSEAGQTVRGRTPDSRLISDLVERAMELLAKDPEIRDLLRND